jgi:YHS domain-containing protein
MGRRHGGTERGEHGDVRWAPPETDTDPVCGKIVSTASAKSSVFDGLVYYFCSRECREVFEAAPHLYAGRNAPASQGKLENLHG